MMFEFVRCSKNDVRVRSMFDKMVFDPSLIKVCDADHSGVIEFNEFILMMHDNDKISEEEVRAGFRLFDKNGDGVISSSELK